MKKKQEIILIAAMAENQVIGKDNAMPWSIKGNLAHFKETTIGWPCIMGRKTWDSLPVKPLPGRLNIIISKNKNFTTEYTEFHGEDSAFGRKTPCNSKQLQLQSSVVILSSLNAAIESCANYEKVFICGGESIYTQAMPYANKIILTLIPGNYDGDTYFPKIDESWKKTDTVNYENFSIITYTKE
ncbi:MAG: dihydrofolate reductase [Treponema sp.]|nr:dihydrofolate reductase [Treponema sp.]